EAGQAAQGVEFQVLEIGRGVERLDPDAFGAVPDEVGERPVAQFLLGQLRPGFGESDLALLGLAHDVTSTRLRLPAPPGGSLAVHNISRPQYEPARAGVKVPRWPRRDPALLGGDRAPRTPERRSKRRPAGGKPLISFNPPGQDWC